MGTPELFTNQYAPLAISVGQRLGVDPSLLLGQWGIETGWGKSVIPGTNNLGNIMDFSGGGVPAKDNLLQRWDNYRVFKTPEEFGDHYVDLIQRRYPGVSGSGTDSTKFATALKQGGYAEDPNYVNAVVNTVNTLRNRPQAMETLAKASPNVNTMSVDRVVGAYNKAKAANDAEAMAEIQGVLTTRFNNARQKAQAAGDTAAADEIDARLQSLIGGNTAAIPVPPPVPVQGSPLPPLPTPVEETPAVAPGVESAPPSAEAVPVAAPVVPPVAAPVEMASPPMAAPTAPALAPPPPAPAPAAPALSTADILAGRTAPVAPAAPAGPVVPKREVTDAAFNSDPKWISNAKQVYKDVQGSEFGGSDAEAADWLKNYVAQTKWNMAGGATTIVDAMKMSPEGKKALLDSIKDYGDAPTSLESVGRAIKGIGTDPTTYLTLGLGNLVTKTLGKKLAQEGVKQVLESGVSNRLVSGATAKAAATGAGYGASNDMIEQGVQIAADGQESIDPTKLATSTAIGAGAGAGINKILEKVTGRGAVRSLAQKSGSEADALTNAEIISKLVKEYDNPARTILGNTPNLQRREVNARVTTDIMDEARGVVNSLPRDFPNRDLLVDAAKKGINNSQRTLDELAQVPGGQQLLDVINKAVRADRLTAPNPSNQNFLIRGARTLSDFALPGIISKPINYMLKPRGSSEDVTRKLIDNYGPASEKIMGLGLDSPGTSSIKSLQEMAKEAASATTARRAVQAETKAAEQAAKAASERELTNKTLKDQAAVSRATVDEVTGQTGIGSPISGAYNTFLNETGLSNREAIPILRKLSKDFPDNELGVAATQLRKSSNVPNDSGFYALQNFVRDNKGALGIKPGALSDVSPIRNPISYAANVRTAESALKLAQDSAPNNGLAQFANVVARTKSPEAKAALVQKRLMQTSDPAEVQYLTDFIEPLTRFGAKTK